MPSLRARRPTRVLRRLPCGLSPVVRITTFLFSPCCAYVWCLITRPTLLGRCANLVLLPPKGTPWFCSACKNPRQGGSSTRGNYYGSLDQTEAATHTTNPETRKRFFHHMTTAADASRDGTKRRPRKKAHKAIAVAAPDRQLEQALPPVPGYDSEGV